MSIANTIYLDSCACSSDLLIISGAVDVQIEVGDDGKASQVGSDEMMKRKACMMLVALY